MAYNDHVNLSSCLFAETLVGKEQKGGEKREREREKNYEKFVRGLNISNCYCSVNFMGDP